MKRIFGGLFAALVLQFAFSGEGDNPHLPHMHEHDSVVYTGTHDNDTTMGWWQTLDAGTRSRVHAEVPDPGEQMPWPLIGLALSSRARLAVVPAQDLLGLGSAARMNTPGGTQGNWAWRAAARSFTTALAARMASLVETTRRSG